MFIAGINGSKTLTKHIQCECQYDCKKYHICEKDYIWNPATCCCKKWKYLASIMDAWVISCAEIIVSH